MSVDPAAANAPSAANANAAAIEALVQSELQALATSAQQLQQQVTTGQVVTATVLPPNGLTDLISVLGSRVAAALPPTLTPGDTFTAQVTGFNGTQILLQMLSTAEPGGTSGAGSAGVDGSPVGTPIPIPTETGGPEVTPNALQAAAAPPPLPEGVTPSMAPPPAVFVAASVRPAAPPPPGAPVATPPAPVAQATPPQPVTVLADIEARLVAARAGQVVVVPSSSAFSAPPVQSPVGLTGAQPPPAPSPIPGAPLPIQPGGGQAQQQPPPLLTAGRYNIPPTITPSTRFNGTPPPPPANAVPEPAPEPPPTGLAAYREPQALVRALGLPVTPTNLAAAKLAIDTPQRLPAALATLESALPQSDDPRVATLRTLTAFIGKIDPGSPQLAAQISSFVDNVVTGNETKLVQLLTAQLAVDAPPGGVNPEAEGAPAAAAQANAETPAGAAPAVAAAVVETLATPEPALPVLALAQLAERGAALGNDLKTQLLSIVNAPPAGSAAGDLVPAASTALTAITAVQMNAAQALSASPQTMSFTIPMWLGAGYAQARVAIDRDAANPDGKTQALDGDNFHIAFVLDTKHLGTVSVDLQTVGRAFSLAVRTENEKSAQRFGANISRLTERLESLRYQVKSAEASVAPRGVQASGAAEPVTEGDVEDGVPSDVNVRA